MSTIPSFTSFTSFASFIRLAALGALLVIPSAALAQKPKTASPANDRGAIYVNGGYQAGASDVQSTVSFTANVETGSFTSKFHVKEGPALDAGARVRVWKRLSIGAVVTSFTANGDATVTGKIPHPFFFQTPRTIEGTTSNEHKETSFQLRAIVTSPAGRKLQFSGFAGPAFFSLKQTVVDRVNYSEAYPFDTATFTSAATRVVSRSKTGIGIGGDVAYYFTKNLGVGLSATYAKVTFDLKAVDDSTISVSAGGAVVGLGVRIRF